MTSTPDQLATTEKLLQFDTSPKPGKEEQEDTALWGSKRLIVAVFVFFGYINLFMLKGNLSIALVEMTSNKTIISGNETIFKAPEFDWDSHTKNWILSLFSYGSLFAIFGGYLASKHGGVTITGVSLLITALLTLFTSIFIRTNIYIYAVARVAEGILETFAYSGIFDIWSRWLPKNEISKVASSSHNGYYVGAAITFPAYGFIAQYYGWPMIFYFSGGIVSVWSLLLLKYVRDDPVNDIHISKGELNYLNRTANTSDRKNVILITYPWKKILFCKALWILSCCKFTYGWTRYIIIFSFPLYIKDVTNQPTVTVGLISGIPNYVNLFMAPMSGLFIDYLQNNRGVDILKRYTPALCFVLGGLLFVVICYSNFIVSMICFILIATLHSTCFNILQTTTVCLSPDHAGFIAGIGAFWFSLSSVLSAEAVGLTVTNRTWQEWSICFATCGGIMIFTGVVVLLYGNFGDQKWSSKGDTSKGSEYEQDLTYSK